jgi:hypothetical protein
MDRVEKLRAKQAAKFGVIGGPGGVKAPLHPDDARPSAVPGKAPGVPQDATEPQKPPKSHVQYRCGHKEPVACLESGNCPGCASKARKARGKRRKSAEDNGRLPDKAKFAVEYDAEAQEWYGFLSGCGEDNFHGSASGVEALLRQLAGQYRESLRGGES